MSGRGGVRSDPDAGRWRRLGVTGAVLVFVGLSLLTLLSTSALRPADESAHVGYAVTIAQEGRLPTLSDTVERSFPGQRALPQHTANHPPLYYVLIAPVLGAGAGEPGGSWAVLAARVVTALFGALTVVLVAAFGNALTDRRRPDLVVAAACLVASLPTFVPTSSFVQNDSLATCAAVLAFLGVTLMVRTGLRPWPLVLVAVGCTAAVATRAQGIGTLAACMAGLAVVAGFGGRTSWSWRRAGHGVLAAIGLAGIVAAAIGWFYLRNLSLYGDPTGSAFVIDRLALDKPTPPLLSVLFDVDTPLTLFGVIPWWWSTGSERDYPGILDMVGNVAIVAVYAIGMVGLLVRRRRDPARSLVPTTARGGAMLAVLVLTVVGTAAMATSHVSAGGNLHFRYIFPALGITVVVFAGGLLSFPRTRGLVVVGVLATQAVLTLRYAAVMTRPSPNAPIDGNVLTLLSRGLADNGVPAAPVVLALLLLTVAAGCVLVGRSLWKLTSDASCSAKTAPKAPNAAVFAELSEGPVPSAPARRSAQAGEGRPSR